MSATCKSCSARVIWAMTGTGSRMPLDAEPLGPGAPEAGSFILIRDEDEAVRHDLFGGREPQLWAMRYIAVRDGVRTRYRSHFATCPQADEHRRKKAGAA